MTSSTDRIEKKIQLRATQARVWRALSNSAEFGEWFGVKLQGPFKAGAPIDGHITIKGYEHMKMDMRVQRIDPEHYFSFHWHPYAIDPKVDYSNEPMTLCEFTLEAKGEETLLTIVESGFDKIPEQRRLEAFPRNDKGWAAQTENIRRYVEK